MQRKIKLGLISKAEKIKLFGTENEVLNKNYYKNLTQIYILGNKEVQVDGCVGVIDYNETLVKLNIGKGTITFLGKDFLISSLQEGTVTISGFINSVEFCV